MSGIKLYGVILALLFVFLIAVSSDNSAKLNLNIHSAPPEGTDIPGDSPSISNPSLLEYKVNKSTEIWSAEDPTLYITPHASTVQLHSKKLKLTEINESIYIFQYQDGTPLRLNYVRDQEQFGAEDYWVNPSYYLSHAYNGKTLSGDCEDSALAMTSILIAKGYNTVAILGHVKKNDGTTGRHAWAETIIDGKTYVVDGNILYEKSNFQTTREWSPRYMWNDVITFREYSPDWNEIQLTRR